MGSTFFILIPYLRHPDCTLRALVSIPRGCWLTLGPQWVTSSLVPGVAGHLYV